MDLEELCHLGDLELSTRAYNALARENIKTVGCLLKLDPKEIMRWQNVGTRTYREIRDAQARLSNNLTDTDRKISAAAKQLLDLLEERYGYMSFKQSEYLSDLHHAQWLALLYAGGNLKSIIIE